MLLANYIRPANKSKPRNKLQQIPQQKVPSIMEKIQLVPMSTPFPRSGPDKTTGHETVNYVDSSLAPASAATPILELAGSRQRSIRLVPACMGGSPADWLGHTHASSNQ